MARKIVRPPEHGIWRVERSPSTVDYPPALSFAELNDPNVGNRFDSPDGSYRVKYFCTQRVACFGETMARFRNAPGLEGIDLDDDGMMKRGELPADWRQSRTSRLVEVVGCDAVPRPLFLDVEDFETRREAETAIAPVLAVRSVAHLDVPEVRGPDRILTRTISAWAYGLRDTHGRREYAGLRFASKLNSEWECWAVFEGSELHELRTEAITSADEDLQYVAKHFGIRAY